MKIKFSLMCFVAGIALFSFTSMNVKAQFLEPFLMKEGLQLTKMAAADELTKPVLVAVLSMDNVSEDGVPFSLEMIYEGADIGKSNNWFFIFTEEGDTTQAVVFVMLKMLGIPFIDQGSPDDYNFVSFSNPIDESQLIDSDEFVASLMNNPDFNRATGDTMAAIGVFTMKSTSYAPCFSDTESRWYYASGIENNSAFGIEVLYCCFAPYFDVSETECENYVSIEESPAALSINIFPNPVSDYLLISNSDDLQITNIEIFDISGNLISVFSSDSVVLDVSGLPSGSYFVCFTVSNRKVYRSFIKE